MHGRGRIATLPRMWGRSGRASGDEAADKPRNLRDAIRDARIAAAERTGVIVEMRDADIARLEILNEALDPVFTDVPSDIEMFDRAISKGDTPRLWIDMLAHVAMARDKRTYRFLQDTRYGRRIIAESQDVPEIVQAVTRYVAGRLVERERALASDSEIARVPAQPSKFARAIWSAVWTTIWALAAGLAAFFVAAWFLAKP